MESQFFRSRIQVYRGLGSSVHSCVVVPYVCRVLDAKDRFADALSGGWTAGKSASEIAVTRPKKSQFNFSEKNIRLKVFSPADLIPIPLYHVILGVVVAIM